ncbi:hypothetical protein BKA62DRAFT_774677 [Auriculariales sp. MPI-PUGE-AT-0066]|nr:hypothetical protein BKA62DRAFT_774677 [Auriculariales sp. MPI-PUGE-AT-0066]
MSTSSSSSSSSSSRHSRMSKPQLRKHLEILDSIPLFEIPAILPLSPPTSREGSPAPSLKRKLEETADVSSNKRARMSPDAHSISSSHTAVNELPSPPKTSSSQGSPPQPQLPDSDNAPTPVTPLLKVDLEYWHRRQSDYIQTGTALRRSADARYHRMHNSNYSVNERIAVFLEFADALTCYSYGFWLQDLIHVQRDRTSPATYAGNHWETMLPQVGLLDDRSRKACPPPNDPMFQRFTVVKRMADRLGAFLMALQSRKLNADAQHSLKGLRQRDGTSPPSAGSPSSTSPPGQSPGSAASGLNPKTLDIISRALSYSQKSTDRIAQGNEDPQLRPQALAQTFPRTCKRVSAADGHAFRELVPRKGAQEDFALELDAAGGPSPDQPAFTQLEWPMAPLSQHGAGIGPLCLVLRSMIWELGADVGYTYKRGIIRIEK